MTKPLPSIVKRNNKMRKQALRHIGKLLKNKDVSITINQENQIDRVQSWGSDNMELVDSGFRKLTLEWRENKK